MMCVRLCCSLYSVLECAVKLHRKPAGLSRIIQEIKRVFFTYAAIMTHEKALRATCAKGF